MLSFGGGQDSTAILYKLVYDSDFRARYAPGRVLVVMSDTGDEHPHTYEHVAHIERFCTKHGVEFHLIKPEMGFHSPGWRDLRGTYRRTGTCGSKCYRKSCTVSLKINPLYKFLESWLSKHYGVTVGRKRGFYEFAERHGRIRVILGIAAGEESRIAKAELHPWRGQTVEKVYPLVDLGMDRRACQEYIASTGHPIPPPSNCMLCPFLSLQELLWLYRFYPADFWEWVEIEKAKLKKFASLGEKNFGVWGRKTLPEVLEEAQRKFGHLTDAELQEHKFSHGHGVKSAY